MGESSLGKSSMVRALLERFDLKPISPSSFGLKNWPTDIDYYWEIPASLTPSRVLMVLRHAALHAQVVLCDEMNTLNLREEELNQLVSGQDRPGFLQISTENQGKLYGGRQVEKGPARRKRKLICELQPISEAEKKQVIDLYASKYQLAFYSHEDFMHLTPREIKREIIARSKNAVYRPGLLNNPDRIINHIIMNRVALWHHHIPEQLYDFILSEFESWAIDNNQSSISVPDLLQYLYQKHLHTNLFSRDKLIINQSMFDWLYASGFNCFEDAHFDKVGFSSEMKAQIKLAHASGYLMEIEITASRFSLPQYKEYKGKKRVIEIDEVSDLQPAKRALRSG
jgi:hypothetical protein